VSHHLIADFRELLYRSTDTRIDLFVSIKKNVSTYCLSVIHSPPQPVCHPQTLRLLAVVGCRAAGGSAALGQDSRSLCARGRLAKLSSWPVTSQVGSSTGQGGKTAGFSRPDLTELAPTYDQHSEHKLLNSCFNNGG
jgi:hypothetical protein